MPASGSILNFAHDPPLADWVHALGKKATRLLSSTRGIASTLARKGGIHFLLANRGVGPRGPV